MRIRVAPLSVMTPEYYNVRTSFICEANRTGTVSNTPSSDVYHRKNNKKTTKVSLFKFSTNARALTEYLREYSFLKSTL